MLHPLSLSVACLLMMIAAVRAVRDAGDPGLRSLLMNERNQELIDHLGTRYEIVYPHQVRKDWGRGLSTHLSTINGTVLHVPETTLLIETFEYKLHLELELNTKLFVPTLVQFVYQKYASPVAIHKLPENCYYHAKIRSYPEAKAALQTCHGIRGVIYLAEKTFFIHPLHGNYSLQGKHPHLLFHHFPEDDFRCGNPGAENGDSEEEPGERHEEKDDWHRKKFIEMALVLDHSLFQKFRSPPPEVLSAAIEIVNHVDLMYRPLNTSVSLVYIELWLEDQMPIFVANMSATLHQFKEYSARHISRISVDTTHLLTGIGFEDEVSGLSFLDSICTNNAVGLSQVRNIYQPHLTAFVLAHMVGHNLGMNHDHSGCDCRGCIMENNMPIFAPTSLSRCSVQAYHRTLSRGYGACLYNMPAMRVSICGNNILEEPEQCDCGTVEECLRSNLCCDPITCRLIKHAQCSSGSCCRKCKLLSPDHLCRPSKGECDIPEFCDGRNEECPEDVFKRNGAVCSGGLGYCFQGECPVLKHQCQDIWGEGAESADTVCFDRLNVQGTPNGNCGTDGRGGIAKCPPEHSSCGFLQCRSGEKTPVSSMDDERVQFVVHKITAQGTVHECKARTLPTSDLAEGLVREGTKCGYQKLCFNQTCTSVKSLVSSKCPMEEIQNTCSGHGICTNANTCFCDDGWKGPECGTVDQDWRDYYYPPQNASENPHHYAETEMRVNPNLAITVIAASTVIGVGLVLVLMLLFFFRRT